MRAASDPCRRLLTPDLSPTQKAIWPRPSAQSRQHDSTRAQRAEPWERSNSHRAIPIEGYPQANAHGEWPKEHHPSIHPYRKLSYSNTSKQTSDVNDPNIGIAGISMITGRQDAAAPSACHARQEPIRTADNGRSRVPQPQAAVNSVADWSELNCRPHSALLQVAADEIAGCYELNRKPLRTQLQPCFKSKG
jgi:hypothetical protein